MAIVASNGLTGPDGVQPTAGSLADTGTAPVFLDNSGMLYTDDILLRNRNSTQLRTGPTRGTSSRFSWPMPSGAWTLRLYAYPELMAPDYDINERRMFVEWGTHGLMVRESAARNVVQRLQNISLASENVTGTESGNAVSFDQAVRFEIMYDGAGTMISRIYPGDSLSGFRQNQWSHTPTGNSITISGMRWYNYPVLQSGDTDATTDGQVTVLQNQILVWDPNALPVFGADGDYDGETTTAVSNFQSAMGLTVTGAAGPETRTALALYVRLDNDPDDYPDPIWVGNMAITDTADWIGPLDPSSTEVELVSQASAYVVAEDTTTAAHIQVESEVIVGESSKSVNAEAHPQAEVEVQAGINKSVGVDAQINAEASVNVTHTAVSFIPDPPPLVPTFRLAIYNPNAFGVASDQLNGALRGYIYRPLNVQVSSAFNDVGSMTFSLPESSPEMQYISGTETYDEFFEVGFELMSADGTDFVEPPNMRFYAMRREFDEADRAGIVTWTLISCAWVFRGIRPSNVSSINGDWAARFTSVRAVDVILGYLDQYAFEFGSNQGVAINWNFTGSLDSNGASWTGTTFDIEYPVNAMLDNTLDSFADQRNFDWRFVGREFQLFLPDTVMNQDYSTVGPSGVYLRTGRDMLEARDVISYEHRRARTVTFGANFVTIGGGSDIITPYGAGHDITAAPGITSPSPLILQITNARRQDVGTTNRAMYRRFLCRRMDQVPLRDYNPGDRVRVQSRTPGREYAQNDFDTRRIREIVLTAGSDRVLECTMTLEYRFLPKDVQIQREQRQITGGSANRGAGTWNRTFGP